FSLHGLGLRLHAHFTPKCDTVQIYFVPCIIISPRINQRRRYGGWIEATAIASHKVENFRS
ncbi:MAG TPA: hypothetical protein VKB53_04720, partial [Gammaproteobacteria bacterium]|nr:hypothetical protein [Gammaproteobacteria bacterium]